MRRQFKFKVSGHMRVGNDVVAFTRIVRASTSQRAVDAAKRSIRVEPRYFGKDIAYVTTEVTTW